MGHLEPRSGDRKFEVKELREDMTFTKLLTVPTKVGLSIIDNDNRRFVGSSNRLQRKSYKTLETGRGGRDDDEGSNPCVMFVSRTLIGLCMIVLNELLEKITLGETKSSEEEETDGG